MPDAKKKWAHAEPLRTDTSKRTRDPNKVFSSGGNRGRVAFFLFGRVPAFFHVRRFFPVGTVGSLPFARWIEAMRAL